MNKHRVWAVFTGVCLLGMLGAVGMARATGSISWDFDEATAGQPLALGWTIAAAGGTVLATCDQQETLIVADVLLDPALKTTDPPACYGIYNKPMPPASTLYQALTGTIGTLWYSRSRERRDQACAISGTCDW